MVFDRRLAVLVLFASLATAGATGCESEPPSTAGPAGEGLRLESLEGEPVDPPFDVKGDASGLLLVWFDASGAHTAQNRDAIPEDRRQHVRVDSLRIAPEQRLDPDHVYVADMRSARAGGEYPVRKVARDAFEAMIDAASRTAAAAAGAAHPSNGGDDVIIYGASWCGACKAAARFLRSRGVPFEEKDVERDASARAEMEQKARAAGVRPSGIPVIDFRGRLLLGFDQATLDQLIGPGAQPI